MSDDSTDFPPEFDLDLGVPLEIPGDPVLTVTPEKVIGRGSFGIVYLVCDADGRGYALKLVMQDRRYKNREFQIMKSLRHPNICFLRRGVLVQSQQNPEDLILYLLMEYYPETIHGVYRQYTRLRQHLPLIIVRIASYQLARALAYLHHNNIAHRDCKPTNVLIDPQTLHVALCDFGSAKQLVEGEPNVSYICSRFYRAPELIVGNTAYSTAIDVWGFGCILAELLLGQPLFQGDSSVDQLVEIVRVLGSPTAEDFAAMNPALPAVRFREVRPFPLSKMLRNRAHQEAIDLLTKILVYNPSRRPKAIEILAHPFFAPLRKQGTPLPSGERLPDYLFEFTPEEEEDARALGIWAKLQREPEEPEVQSSSPASPASPAPSAVPAALDTEGGLPPLYQAQYTEGGTGKTNEGAIPTAPTRVPPMGQAV